MKKNIIIAALCFIALACNGERKNIETATMGYCEAMSNYNINEAESYCTEETKATTIMTAKLLLPFVDTAYIASDTPATIEIKRVHRISDTSAVVHYRKVTPIKDFTDTLELRKRDGKWLAHSPIVKNNAAAQ